MLSTNFDWKSESRKVWNVVWKSEKKVKIWKVESLKCATRKCCPIRKFFFSSFFLDQVEPKSEKKMGHNKSENFEKFGHFLLPVLRNKAQDISPDFLALVPEYR